MLMQRCWHSTPGSSRHSSRSSPGRLLGSSLSRPRDKASRLPSCASDTGTGRAWEAVSARGVSGAGPAGA